LKANQKGWPFLFQRVLTTVKILWLSVIGQLLPGGVSSDRSFERPFLSECNWAAYAFNSASAIIAAS